jgi:hypothetical protein
LSFFNKLKDTIHPLPGAFFNSTYDTWDSLSNYFSIPLLATLKTNPVFNQLDGGLYHFMAISSVGGQTPATYQVNVLECALSEKCNKTTLITTKELSQDEY